MEIRYNVIRKKELKLDVQTAKSWIKQFWIVYNNITMYGGAQHPSIRSSAGALHEKLTQYLKKEPAVALILRNEALYINNQRVDRLIRLERLMERLQQLGITYIVIRDLPPMKIFLAFLLRLPDTKKITTNQQLHENMPPEESRFIKINTLSSEEINYEELIRESRSPHRGAPSSGPSGTGVGPAGAVGSLLRSLHQSTDNGTLSSRVLQTAVKKSLSSGLSTSGTLRYLAEIKTDGMDSPPVQQWLQNRGTGLDNLADAIQSQINVHLGRLFSEYLSGRVSLFHLGNHLRLTLKPPRETLAFMKLMKKILINHDFDLIKYLSLLEKVAWTMDRKGLDALIKFLKGDICLSFSDLRSIRPRASYSPVPVLLLMIRISSFEKITPRTLSDTLSHELNQILFHRLRNHHPPSSLPEADMIRSELKKAQKILLNQLLSGGAPSSLIQDVEKNLDAEISFRTGILRADHLIHRIARHRFPRSFDKQVEVISRELLNQPAPEELVSPLIAQMKQSDYTTEQIGLLIARLNREDKLDIPLSTLQSISLPEGIESLSRTREILSSEYYRFMRYHSPVSTISISIFGVRSGEGYRTPSREEKIRVLSQLSRLLNDSLRQIDRVGTLGDLKKDHILLILPMTDTAGTGILVQRLKVKHNTVSFSLYGKSLEAALLFSFKGISRKEKDFESWMDSIRVKHEEKKRDMMKLVSGS